MDGNRRIIRRLCSIGYDADFAGIIDALLNVCPRRTVSEIAELAIAPSELKQIVMVRMRGERKFIATMLDRPLLEKNLIAIARQVGLSKPEQTYLLAAVARLQY